MTLSNTSRQSVNDSKWNPAEAVGRGFSSLLDRAGAVANQSRMQQNLEHAINTNAAHHAAAMEQAYAAGSAFSKQEHEQSEASLASHHARRLELLKGVNQSAEPGTDIQIGHGDFNASFTRKNKTPRAPQPTIETTPVSSGPTMPAAPTQEDAPKPLVKRGAGGRMEKLDPQKSVTQTTKKAAPKATGPTVKRGAGGRMVSLKSK